MMKSEYEYLKKNMPHIFDSSNTANFSKEIEKAKKPSCLDVIAGIALMLPCSVAGLAWMAYCTGKLCTWYMPSFGLTPLTFTQLVGIALALCFVKHYVNPIKSVYQEKLKTESLTKVVLGNLVHQVMLGSLILLAGWFFAPPQRPAPSAAAQVEAAEVAK